MPNNSGPFFPDDAANEPEEFTEINPDDLKGFGEDFADNAFVDQLEDYPVAPIEDYPAAPAGDYPVAPMEDIPPAAGMVPIVAAEQVSHGRHAQQTAYAPAGQGMISQYSRHNAEYTSHGGRGTSGGKGKKAIVVIVIIALLAAIGGLGFYIYKESQKAAINADLHKLSAETMKAVEQELTGNTTFDAPFTVLLLGSDARLDDPDMGARTDTIILVRVDPITNTISMMSIPRDTKIDIEGVGAAKFNAAYTYGGPSGTIAAVKNLTGIDIDHYAEINFENLVSLVDAIGGIDVTVDERIDDPDAGDIVIEAGDQHLDGAATLVFARSRAYVDGDYTRQRNQRKVIDAIIHRGLEAPAAELTGIIQASTEFLTTDSALDFDFIYSLAQQIRHNNDYPVTIYAANIPSGTATIDGVSYVVADTAGVAEMSRKFLAGEDISGGASVSSLNEDEAAAGESANGTTITPDNGYDANNYNYNYDPNYGNNVGYNTGYVDNGYANNTTYGNGGGQGYDQGGQGYGATYDNGTQGYGTTYDNGGGQGYDTGAAQGYDTTYNNGGQGYGNGADTGYGTGQGY